MQTRLASGKTLRHPYSGYEPSCAGALAIHGTNEPGLSWLPRLHEVSIGSLERQGHGH